MKTVYLLGAGASNASKFDLPTMNGFFREEDFSGRNFSELCKYLSDTFPTVPVSGLNLEEVVTHLELSLGGFASLWSSISPDIISARQEFDKYIRSRLVHYFGPSFGGNPPNESVCDLHKQIIEEIKKKNGTDSILSLNYDLVCDFAINHTYPGSNFLENSQLLLLPPSYVTRTPAAIDESYVNSGLYLKLHGSINWVFCPNPKCPHHNYFFVNSITEMKEEWPPESLCFLCGAGLVSVIIPPTLTKSFEQFPKMSLIWSLAFQKLSSASRWVVIGVSLAPSDSHLRWLLREAVAKRDKRSKPQIEVVNPDAIKPNSYLKKEIGRIVGVEEKELIVFENFQDYVEKKTISPA